MIATMAQTAGTAFVFTRMGTTWTEQAKLTASDGAAGDQFGYSVAMAVAQSRKVVSLSLSFFFVASSSSSPFPGHLLSSLSTSLMVVYQVHRDGVVR